MNVLGIRWLGVRAERYDDMVAFFRKGLGLAVEFEEEATTELSLANGDRVQVFGTGHRYHELFAEQATGPVPLFEVNDVHAAVDELELAGAELIGKIERDQHWEWANFRAPDGNLYEVASMRSTE
jgi:catechol 2,3-dioxygenase-like lactoylglutathione lyase family enzyme